MPVSVQQDRVVAVHGQSELEVMNYGATITSWKFNGQEKLFVSSKAVLDQSKAIRGGIPLVFPQFGPGILPQHGFARVSRWKWAGVTVDHIQQLTISFSLTPEAIPASQRTLWPFDFRLVYNVTLSANTLKTELVISNTGNVPFNFTCLFHTYLLCQTDHVVVYGLDGATRKDNGSDSFVADHRPMITIDGHVDALFRNSNRYISVAGCNLVIDNGLDNVVLWNPWVEKAKEMSDFGDLEFKNMLCVECGKVDEPVALNSGCIFNASQTLIALP